MRCRWIWTAALSLPLAAVAQSALPAGTILPISLDGSLNAAKMHVGQTIRGTIMQTIPGTRVHRGAKVMGEILRVSTDSDGKSQVSLRFDTIRMRGQSIPVRTNLRAVASFLEVEEAQMPEEIASRGISPDTATTQQIGGEQVYRGGGPVTSGLTVVGKPVPYGVLVVPRVKRGMACRGSISGNKQAQALWLFSSDACGVYGYSELHIAEAGRYSPSGE
ncbi:MAG: hypothetical protein WCA37_09430, partial [Terracidiphilus sp.]